MSRWFLRGRGGIAVLLAATFLALSLCPAECLAAADTGSTAVAPDCHDSAPAEGNHAASHDLACCHPSAALGARSGAEAAALEPPPVLFAALPVTPLAARPLGARSLALGIIRHGPEPFLARSPILLI